MKQQFDDESLLRLLLTYLAVPKGFTRQDGEKLLLQLSQIGNQQQNFQKQIIWFEQPIERIAGLFAARSA